MIHNDSESSSGIGRNTLTGLFGRLAQKISRSVMLTLVLIGCALIVFAAVVLQMAGLETSSGLLAVSGFNIVVIGLIGHFTYNALENWL